MTVAFPIEEVIPEVKEVLAKASMLILQASPGAGKSTVLPLALLEENWLAGRKILLLEPRRLAAAAVASRMADQLGEKVGQTVGYQMRLERKVSPETRLLVVTEGILIQMIQTDNELNDFGLIIFDEFHERNLFSDLSFTLCHQVREILRPDLRMVIMSATLDAETFADRLKVPVIVCPGRQYPVEIIYTGEIEIRRMVEETAAVVRGSLRRDEGDILVFLPGQSEIERCYTLLSKTTEGVVIHKLYGLLSLQEQRLAIQPDRNGRRRVVIATSIAETSLTIEGINIVIDAGYTRQAIFNAQRNMPGLSTTRISQDVADQRSGRAGRLAPGKCYRLWSLATEHRLKPYREPEILSADLLSLALELTRWGVRDLSELEWLTVPKAGDYAHAIDVLQQFGAIENHRLTPHGEKVYQLGAHPRLANMLIHARFAGLGALGSDLAAVLESTSGQKLESVDVRLRLEELWRNKSGSGFKRNAQVQQLAERYRKLLKINANTDLPVDFIGLGWLVALAFPERIAKRKKGTEGQFVLAGGQVAFCGADDPIAHENWIVVAQVDMRKGAGKIFMAASLDERDIDRLPKTTRRVVGWEESSERAVAWEELCLGTLIISKKPVPIHTEEISTLMKNYIRDKGESALNFNAEVKQWQERVLSLRSWDGPGLWPDVRTGYLLNTVEKWLLPFLPAVDGKTQLLKLDLTRYLSYLLSYEQQIQLDLLAPEHFKAPGGSSVRIKYQENGEAPSVAVRLQELFGLLDTPTVYSGKRPIVLHLLSPGFKPIQVTTDLRSFWSGTYFEVRKELKRRYPKHAWPDEPLKASPVRGVPKRR